MKKIALIADGWKRLVTYSWVDGIIKQAEGFVYRFGGDEFVIFYISIIKCTINLALMCRFMVHFYL